MTSIPDDQLFKHADRVQGKVVIITGGANGIGKESALRFASHGAKVIIGDSDVVRAQGVVSEILQSGGVASFVATDVTKWDDQVALFEYALGTYGSVDVVVPNAGIWELRHRDGFTSPQFKDGKPVPPSLRTLDVNLTGALYTTNLALHYLFIGQKDGDLKSLVLIGSMASWGGFSLGGELYAASKHAILGLMRSLHRMLDKRGVRIACICPFFTNTELVPTLVKAFLAGIPTPTVPRIAGAIFYAATDPDTETSGSAWLLADDGPVFLVPKEKFKAGVYAMIDQRVNSITKCVRGMGYCKRLLHDIWKLSGPLHKYALSALILGVAWKNRAGVEAFTSNVR
ncbi:NAD(P)-binding protein [Coprinopsis marcescibilis]|uniref:NAD(P)-binding protein n=1 Tax=Coprinopsis marcescibilis TaxID=230819 RepID=A0A5C3KZB4_COPMA|nr:NAD(P)-binding protein [Coprinopsis marcescibilis]